MNHRALIDAHAKSTSLSLAVLMALLLTTSPAVAQNVNQTVGGMFTQVGNEFGRILPDLVLAASLLLSVFLVATGLARLVEMSNGGREGLGKDASMRLLGGGFLASVPLMLGSISTTFFGQKLDGWGSADIQAATPNACFVPTGGGIPFGCVAENIAMNVAKPGTLVLFGLAFVAGTYLVASGLYKLAVSQGQGNQAEAKTWLPRVIFGALLAQIPPLIGTIAFTLGYSSSIINVSGLQQVAAPSLSIPGPNGMSSVELNSMLGNIFMICVLFGVLAVWRGIAKLRSFSEGQEREGIGMAMTHIVGGVMLTNVKMTICFVMGTFMGNGMGFC